MKILDYIFLMRPMLIIPVWTISLLGAKAALWREHGTNPFSFDHFPFNPFTGVDVDLLLMLIWATLLFGGGFIFNQIYDIESDRKNNKLFLLADGHVSLKEAWILYFLTTALAIVGAFLLNWQLGVMFVILAWLGVQYSHPHFKVNENPYKACRNNMLAHGILAFLFGWVMFNNFNIESFIKSVPYMLAVGAVYLNTTLPDSKGDRKAGKITYGIVWGTKNTQTRAIWMVLAAVVTSMLTADYSLTIAAGVSLPFFIYARINKSIETSVLASKVAILALSLFAVIYFPICFVAIVVTILLARVYYAKRFSISYPVLIEEKK